MTSPSLSHGQIRQSGARPSPSTSAPVREPADRQGGKSLKVERPGEREGETPQSNQPKNGPLLFGWHNPDPKNNETTRQNAGGDFVNTVPLPESSSGGPILPVRILRILGTD